METTFNRATVALMLTMRRIVRDEFGVSISLQDQAAPLTLYRYALESRQDRLQEMAMELAELVQPLTSMMVVTQNPKRVYRGQVVEESDTPPTPAPAAHRPRPRRIYRGRVIKD